MSLSCLVTFPHLERYPLLVIKSSHLPTILASLSLLLILLLLHLLCRLPIHSDLHISPSLLVLLAIKLLCLTPLPLCLSLLSLPPTSARCIQARGNAHGRFTRVGLLPAQKQTHELAPY